MLPEHQQLYEKIQTFSLDGIDQVLSLIKAIKNKINIPFILLLILGIFMNFISIPFAVILFAVTAWLFMLRYLFRTRKGETVFQTLKQQAQTHPDKQSLEYNLLLTALFEHYTIYQQEESRNFSLLFQNDDRKKQAQDGIEFDLSGIWDSFGTSSSDGGSSGGSSDGGGGGCGGCG